MGVAGEVGGVLCDVRKGRRRLRGKNERPQRERRKEQKGREERDETHSVRRVKPGLVRRERGVRVVRGRVRVRGERRGHRAVGEGLRREGVVKDGAVVESELLQRGRGKVSQHVRRYRSDGEKKRKKNQRTSSAVRAATSYADAVDGSGSTTKNQALASMKRRVKGTHLDDPRPPSAPPPSAAPPGRGSRPPACSTRSLPSP